MRNRIVNAIIVFITIATTSKAQDTSFYKQPYCKRNSGTYSAHTNIIAFDLNAIYVPYSPYEIKYERGIFNSIGIGINASYMNWGWRTIYSYDVATERIIVSGINPYVSYHFNKLLRSKNFDLYAAAGISRYEVKDDYNNDHFVKDKNTDDINYVLTYKVGANAYFHKPKKHRWGLNIEIGYDHISYLIFGVVTKF